MMTDLIDAVRAHFQIRETVLPETPLLSTGLIDSLRVAALLSLVEERFGVRIEPQDVGTDNFDTPQQMCAVIARMRDAGAP